MKDNSQELPVFLTLIKHIEEQVIKEIPEIKYCDEDWGQLDYYSPNFPVKWPCLLIDINDASFSDLGQSPNLKPKNRQMAELRVTLTLANQRLTNSSAMASKFQKKEARSLFYIIEKLHQVLHGNTVFKGVLIRESMNRVKRDDGVQEYTIVYKTNITNI